jgi:hypothetical protein
LSSARNARLLSLISYSSRSRSGHGADPVVGVAEEGAALLVPDVLLAVLGRAARLRVELGLAPVARAPDAAAAANRLHP